MTIPMLAALLGVLAAVAHVADKVPADRYRRLEDHADLGCGADEYRGPRRFTRPSERTDDTRKAAPGSTAKHSGAAFATTSTPPTRR